MNKKLIFTCAYALTFSASSFFQEPATVDDSLHSIINSAGRISCKEFDQKISDFVLQGGNLNQKSNNYIFGTPLHHILFYENLDHAKILLNNGANITIKNESGTSPLQESIYMQKPYAANFLIDHGALANTPDKEKFDLLTAAAEFSPEILLLLLNTKKFDLNKKIDGVTILYDAVAGLLELYANPTDDPIDLEEIASLEQTIPMLIQHGANPQIRADNNLTPLQAANLTVKLYKRIIPPSSKVGQSLNGEKIKNLPKLLQP